MREGSVLSAVIEDIAEERRKLSTVVLPRRRKPAAAPAGDAHVLHGIEVPEALMPPDSRVIIGSIGAVWVAPKR